MLRAVLFDLDDTLPGNNMERFLPRYFQLLADYAQENIPPARLIQELLASTRQMIANTDPATTNQQAFWQAFCQATGLERASTEPTFERFYREQFPRLRPLTRLRPDAAALVRHCQAWAVLWATCYRP